MKWVLLLAVIALVLWLARARVRPRPPPPPPAPPPQAPALENMVRCAHCDMHLPRSEALPGRGGFYCGEAHRAEHEQQLAER